MVSLRGVVEVIVQAACAFAEILVAKAHRLLMLVQWSKGSNPEFFDHKIDLYYQWLNTRNPLWLERGVFGSLVLKAGGDVLELGCGDGFNACNFYSIRSRRIVACDYDPNAISTAERKSSASNIEYVLGDIRSEMPSGKYDTVIWDAAIGHFEEQDIRRLMADIKSRLKDGGVLSGYTPLGVKTISQHIYGFGSKADLLQFLEPYFVHVKVFETMYPSRHNLYFWASDGVLPFDLDWSHCVSK